ncbi:MAG: thymidine phosphorylase [Verrucomicrobiales bacterium]
MHIPSIIERKRDGKTLTEPEIKSLIDGFTSGDIPDYQMSALAMAIYFNGMDSNETVSLTRAMLASGDVLNYPNKGSRSAVDKHSTGGIGDKVSLVLAPLLACDSELIIPMISGRGLGITGGTLDKLESIPGFNVNLSKKQALAQIDAIGVVMMGQTTDIAPADKKLYALRDVTATVPSQPLIVASIMSKKLAESLDKLVLDVKFGSGAFMQTLADARSLGESMQAVGEMMGVRTQVAYNPMNEPLGHTVGNALEVTEAIATLRGEGPEDLVNITLDLARQVSRKTRDQLKDWLADGSAYQKFLEIVASQGACPEDIDRFPGLHTAKVRKDLHSPASGEILSINAATAGKVSLQLGAGRTRADDAIDFSVGLSNIRKTGENINAGDPLLTVHARDNDSANAAGEKLLSAIRIA